MRRWSGRDEAESHRPSVNGDALTVLPKNQRRRRCRAAGPAMLPQDEVLPDQSRRTVIGFLKRAIASTPVTASPSSRSRPTTAAPTAQRSTPPPAAPSGSAICAPAPTDPKPNGKAEQFIRTLLGGLAYDAIYRQAPNAPPPLTDSSSTTTITANTQPSATNRPSLASTRRTNLDGTYT